MRTEPFTEPAQTRMVKRSLKKCGWTCGTCHSLNPQEIDGETVTACTRCGTARGSQ